MKTLYEIDLFWGTAYYSPEGEHVCYIHENDGEYNSEYMSDIISYFNGKIEFLGHFSEYKNYDQLVEEDKIDYGFEEPTDKVVKEFIKWKKKSKTRK